MPLAPEVSQCATRDAQARSGPHPLIVFSHGFGGERRQTTHLCTHWASHGYAVVAMDHVGNTAMDMIGAAMGGEAPDPAVLIAEFIMTFLLVISVYSVAIDPRGKAVKIGAFVIGLTVAFDIMVGGGISGASMNPARSFGPALVHMDFTLHWCYWVAPLLGGMAAGLFYHHCLLDKDSGEGDE